MQRPVINPGHLVWSGEHWINYLRPPGTEQESGMVSLYHTRYSAAGEGHAAFVQIPGSSGCCGLFTDNREVAAFILEMTRSNSVFPPDLPLIDAEFRRQGDIRRAPAWAIHSQHHQIVASWSQLQEPLIAEGDAPTFTPDYDFFTLLFFAAAATIHWNGHPVAGAPYQRDVWQKSIGGLRSSCVFALAETKIKVP